MEKSFIEKRIEERANTKLEREHREMREYINSSPFLDKLKNAEGQRLWGNILESYASHYKEGSDMFKAVEERRQELIKAETDQIMSSLEGIKYLFRDE